MEIREITKSNIQDWFFRNKLSKRLSYKKESSFWHSFLEYTPLDNKYFETEKYFFYYAKFWAVKVELRYWKESGKVSTVENSKRFTLI